MIPEVEVRDEGEGCLAVDLRVASGFITAVKWVQRLGWSSLWGVSLVGQVIS